MEKQKSRVKEWMTQLGHRGRQALFAVGLYLCLLLLGFVSVSPEQYDVSVGDVAPQTITARKDIVDELTTERRRKAAEDAVSPVYYKDDSVSDTVMSDLEAAFSEMRSIRELGQQIRESRNSEEEGFTAEDYQQAQKLLTVMNLSNYQLQTLMKTSESDFENLYRSLTSAARTALVSTIAEGQINDAISNIQQIVAYNTRTDLWYNIAIPTLRACLQPNMLIDQAATEENRQKARDAVEPTVYKQDQNIVVKGDRITQEQYAVLQSLGLLAGNRTDYGLYLSAAAVLLFILAAAFLYAAMFLPHLYDRGREALVMAICALFTLVASVPLGSYVGLGVMPVLFAAMMVTSLLGAGEAILANTFVALVLTFLAAKGTDFAASSVLSTLLISTVGGTAAIFLMRRRPARILVIIISLGLGVLNGALLYCVALLSSSDTSAAFSTSAYALAGALLSGILCIGLQSVFESVFGLVTPSKLIELSNPSQPLLRRLMIETPGTYHHSMVVANLAEAAAEAVGADPLLVRVGAYYHDIGKLIRPMYFKENQVGENPHDASDPRVSTAILTEHTRDGVELARKHHLPEPIVDMIRQHHGDSAVMYFYAKAVEMYGEENVDKKDFRYDGPKPQTAEAAILMLSDTVEAAVRSLHEPTHEKISQMIHKLVRGKMEDGQLDDSPLTFRDLNRICAAFETVLQGVFHERIEYPDLAQVRKKAAREKLREKANKARGART